MNVCRNGNLTSKTGKLYSLFPAVSINHISLLPIEKRNSLELAPAKVFGGGGEISVEIPQKTISCAIITWWITRRALV